VFYESFILKGKKEVPALDIENYTIAPYDKGIIIIKDGEFRFMAMPEEIIKICREYDDMAAYLGRESFI